MEGPLLYILTGAVVTGFAAQATAIRTLWARNMALEKRTLADHYVIDRQVREIRALQVQNQEQAAEILLLKRKVGEA